MRKMLLKYIKKLFSDFHSSVVSIIVTLIILSPGVVYIFFRDLWHQLINVLKLSTPLWVTIVLFLALVLYISVINLKPRSPQTLNKNVCPKCGKNTLKLVHSTIRSREYKCDNCGFTDKELKESYHKANIPKI